MWKNQYLLAMAICAGALTTSAMGCELIATVDRSRIQGAGGGGVGGGGGGGGEDVSCSDETKNGDETDVDCGGGDCPKCEIAKACDEADDCESGFCADGVCCDAACDSDCDACTAALKESGEDDGTCGPSKAETECGELTCADGVQTEPGTCDGESTECVPGATTECETFACDPDANACFTTCAEDANCATCHTCTDDGECELAEAGATGLGCEEDQACNATGECKAANGQECTAPEDCGSGNCVDGVCCDTACDGTCMACNVAESAGTCSPIALGGEDADNCEATQVCDGEGACKLKPREACTDDAECASNNCLDTGDVCGPIPTTPAPEP
ncbi:hypothetical protein SOCEGT47_004570 [Sorangium cellulosum]|uniref:Secreted protein n=1 Tax=Sorangium cellulosum TaxID=56 RepID=A0A4P2PTX2_SORCE|nr:hypothetical protein [Sorangium cellulosum]AUX20000.1 hypothetical protein SOCEGT47_004570 [Sorangium cellulosum]